MHALERFDGTRIVAIPEAIDRIVWPEGTLVFRIAADEVLATEAIEAAAVNDDHAIVVRETGFSCVWVDRAAAVDFLESECDWELPAGIGQLGNGSAADRPAFAQGIVAGLPVKVWFERERVLFIVASPFAADFAERLR